MEGGPAVETSMGSDLRPDRTSVDIFRRHHLFAQVPQRSAQVQREENGILDGATVHSALVCRVD